jgi:putative spermidine/putrescine transport system permease protein
MISAVTTSFAWIILLSPFGIVHDILNTLNLIDGPLRLMFTKQGIIIALIYSNLPLMVIILRSALSGIDWSLVKSAYVLGASPFKAFLEVIIPLSLPGIFAGAIVTFSTSLSSFVTPFLLGGTAIKVMATLVYTQLITVYNWPLASSISVILFISTTILVGVITYFLEKRLFGWLKI